MAIIDMDFASGGGTYSETLLWTNPTQSTSWGSTAKTVTLDNSQSYSSYDYLKIVFSTNSNDNKGHILVPVAELTPQGTTNKPVCTFGLESGGAGNIYSRSVRSVSGNTTQLYFTSGGTSYGWVDEIYGVNIDMN